MAHVSLEQVASQAGMSVASLKDTVAIFAEAPRSIILCAEGIVRRPDGYQNVLKLIDLAWITGKWDQPGCGVNTVTEEPNEQGAVDMGAAPEFLPGQALFSDQTARDRFAKAWDATLPAANSGRISSKFSIAVGAVKSAPSMSSEKTRWPRYPHRWRSVPHWIGSNYSSSRIRS